jgi:hypothetical protein
MLAYYVLVFTLGEVLTFFSLNQDGHTQVGKRLYVPRVEDKNSHMRMLNISCIDDLVANSMNILEPAPVDSDGNEREDGNFVLYI